MTTFIPDSSIICENCKSAFYSYVSITNEIDADGFDEMAKNVREGLFNRVECPFCGCEFTYETPLLVYSHKFKIFAAAAVGDAFYKITSLKNALRIASADDIILRKTDFAIEAAEKIRIAMHGLNDAKIEIFKLKKFPEYKNMKNDEEYITFDKEEDGVMTFSHRHFTDITANKYTVNKAEYDSLDIDLPTIPNGQWFKVDKAFVLNYPEAKK